MALVLVAMTTGCDDGGTPAWARRAPVAGAGDGGTVATVNGVAISAVDLAQAIAATARGDGGHGGAPGTARPDRDQVLATVIDQELAAQRATALGLDADPGYREELARLEAQVTGFRRQRLAVLLERDVGAKAPVDPAAVRAYYDQHAARIGTQTRVWQILLRDDTVANTAAGGTSTGGGDGGDGAITSTSAEPGAAGGGMMNIDGGGGGGGGLGRIRVHTRTGQFTVPASTRAEGVLSTGAFPIE